MKKYVLIVLAFVISLFSLTIVYAYSYTNYNRRYDFTIDESYVDLYLNIDNDNNTLRDLMNDIISINSNYGLTVQVSYKADHTLDYVYLTVVESATSIPTYMFGVNGSSNIKSIFESNISASITTRSYNIRPGVSNIFNDETYNSFLNCYRDGINCDFRTGGGLGGYYYRYNTTNVFNNNNNFIVEISNNSDYYILLYTSNFDFIYTTTSPYPNLCSSNSFECYFKNLYINDNLIEVGDTIPTYYDLFIPDPTPTPTTFDDYSNQLGYVYGSNIPKANLSSYKVNIDFNFYDPLFIDSLEVVPYFTGRVDNGDYYSYESIDCSPVGGDYLSLTTTGNKATGYIFPNGITCTSSLTNYDYIYYRLDILPFYAALDDDGRVNPTTFNLHLSANLGIIDNLNYKPKYFIRDYFSGLSNTFGIVLSTNAKYAYTSWYSPNNSTLFESAIDRPDNQAMMFDGGHLYIGSGTNLNKFIFNDPRYFAGTTDIYLYLDNNVIVSISDNDSYSYYDDSNTLSSGTVTKNYYSIPKDDPSYDISYYFDLVNGYIDSISLDIYNLSTVIQEGYDLIPEPFSTLILIFFILSCMGLIFKLIKEN